MAIQKQQLGLQTKLKINEPGDNYEREADRVADQVLAAPAHHDTSGAPPRIQLFSGQSGEHADAAPASVVQALASPGRPLESALRRDMEQRFGYDFSRVRLHSGTAAEQSAEDVNAHAYTVGHDIVLGWDRFGTETDEGRRMIAHELTHVVQQSSAGRNGVVQSNEGGGFSPGLISLPQPVFATVQRKAKRSPGDSPSQHPVKGKPRQTSSNQVSFLIYFDKPLTRSQFIELADMTIYGRPTPGDWKGVPDHLKASDSPIQVWVPASTVESRLHGDIGALPPHIQNFLMKYVGSSEDLQSVANAGFILAAAGVTEDELEVSLLESPKSETTDLVSWALNFVEWRQEQEESARKYEERERRREAEEKELEKWRKRFAKYTDAVLDAKIAELRKEPESGTAKDWLPRFEKERARRRDVRRAQPVTRPETVDQAISMLEEAWRDAEKEDVPDVKRALELVSRIDEWLQDTASSDKYDKYFEGWFRTVAMQTVGMAKGQISGIRAKLYFQGKDNWNRATYLGGHWELGVNSLKGAREYLEVMGAKKSIKETSLHGLQQTTTRILKYEAAGYAIVVAAPVVIATAIEAAPLLSTESLTAAGLRVAPRIMFWAARNPVLATEVGTAIVGTALQVGEDKYLDPVQLIFNILHIYVAMPGRGPSGSPAPTVPHQEGEPDFIITSAPKLDQQTGKVTASVIERASGRQLDAEINITTASGQITDRKTREVVGIISNGEMRRPAPALPEPAPRPTNAPPPQPTHTPPTARPPAPRALTGGTAGTSAPLNPRPPVTVRPSTEGTPTPTLTVKQGGSRFSGTPTGMVRDVDAPSRSVEVPSSSAVFKNKLPANDPSLANTSQQQVVELGSTGAGGPVSPAKIIQGGGAPQDPSRVRMATSGGPPSSGGRPPTAGSVRSSGTAAAPPARGAHPNVIPRRELPARRAAQDIEQTQVDIEPLGQQDLRGAVTTSGGSPSQVPNVAHGEITASPEQAPPSPQAAASPPATVPIPPVMEFNEAVELGRNLVNDSVWLQEIRRIGGLEQTRQADQLRDFIRLYSRDSGTTIDVIPANQASAYGLGPGTGNWGTYLPDEGRIVMHAGIFNTTGVNPVREIGHEVGAAELGRVYNLSKDDIPTVDVSPDVASRMGGDSLTHVIDTFIKVPD